MGRRARGEAERDLGARTHRPVLMKHLKFDAPARRHAHDYHPSPPAMVMTMLCGLDIDVREFVFVDLGSGKGRMLCMASAHPFMRIIGVELAPQLHTVATETVAAFSAPWQKCSKIQLICQDAATYKPPAEPLVVYLYNPFDATILERVVANLASHPRPVYVLYYTPLHVNVLDRAPWLRRVWTDPMWTIHASRQATDTPQDGCHAHDIG